MRPCYCYVRPVSYTHLDVYKRQAKELSSYGYREVNLNLGCPSATVTAKNKGAGFLSVPNELDRFLEQVFSGLETEAVQVSVKTRTGMESHDEFEELLKIYNRYPLKELIIHPRAVSYTHLDVYKRQGRNLGLICPLLSSAAIT